MSRLVWCLGALVGCSLLWSCSDDAVFDGTTEIPSGYWASGEPVTFDFDTQDTVRLYDFYITLRNGEEYPFSNIFLFVDLEFPNGKHSLDTVECMLADPQGRWYGSGTGSRYYNRIRWGAKSKKAFPLAGDYSISIQQAMRTDELSGIYDVGFRLVPVE